MGKKQKKVKDETELPLIDLFGDFKDLIIDFKVFDRDSMALIDKAKNERADLALKDMFKNVKMKKG